MRILEDLQNSEVINTETNPYIYHNEDNKRQLPGEYDDKFTYGMGASHFTEDLRKMQAKEYEGIPCDHSSGATFMKNEYEKEPDLVGTTSDMLWKLLRLQSAPDVDIETFDGNVLNYHYFIALFREVVESKVDGPRGKLTRLIKYTSGDAKELIKHCIELPSNEGFKYAKYLLEKVHGNPHKILASYRKEVKNWQPIKFGDVIAFRRVHSFLLRCQSVATNRRWNALDTPNILCMLTSKLPSGIMERWNREVLKIRRQQHREPNLEDFTKYVEDEAILTSNSLFSRQVLSTYLSKLERSLREDRRKKKVANYRVQSDEESQIKKNENVDQSKSSKEKESCVLCNSSHDLDECKPYNAYGGEGTQKVSN